MLTNSFNVHETVNQNMNPQHAADEYLLGENFHTQEYTTMNNLEEKDYGKENISIQWTAENKNNSIDPDVIVKTTKLRIEAAEFVPRGLSAGSTNINFEAANVDQSAVYNSAGDYNSVPSSEDSNKISWADEAVPENIGECLPSLSSEYYNAEVTKSVPVIPEREFINQLNTVPTRSFEEFVVTNINFTENEQVELNRVDVSVDQKNTLGEINTNKTEFCIEETNQNVGREHISDGNNRNFQPHQQYNREYNRNWKRDNVRSDDNYRHKGKPRYSQSFRENNSRGRNEEKWDYRRTNNSKQENDSDNRPSRRYSDKAKNQDWNHGNHHRKNYQKNSLGSTSEVKHKEEIPQSNESVEKEATPDQTGTTDNWKSSTREHYSKNRFRQRQKESDHNGDEDTVKRKWSERQSFENKEELKNEDKGTKSNNQFRQTRKESEHFSDEDTVKRKWSERQSFDNKEVEELKNQEKGAKPRNKNFQKGSLTNSNNQYKNEGFDEEKHKKERPRRSFDSNNSFRTSKYKTKDYEDETKSYRRSFNKDETEKRPEKSFRDALFTEKKINDKPRDLKQERGSRGEKTPHHHEDYKYKSTETHIDLFDKKYTEFDAEYKAFLQELKENKPGVSEKIKELNEDLFKMSKDYSLAHCVAEDMRMGSGIAVTFRNTFSSVDALLDTREKPGGLAVLKEGSRFLYYLITKKRSRDKPSYKNFWCSMKRLRDHIKKNRITKLAVPTLGCGLDQLHWPTVKHMMGFLFKDVPIEIAVCHFSPTEEAAPNYSVKINRRYDNLKNARESIIVYFISADSHVSDEMLELNKRFSFLDDFKKSAKQFGGVVQSQLSDCLLCGCVVRRTFEDCFSYRSFKIALLALNGIVADKGCDVIALQCLKDEEDDLLQQKIFTLVVNYLKNADVNVYIGDNDVSFGET